MTIHILRTLILMCLIAAGPPAHAVKLYKWVDERGNTVYQDKPPPKNIPFVEEKEFDTETNVVPAPEPPETTEPKAADSEAPGKSPPAPATEATAGEQGTDTGKRSGAVTEYEQQLPQPEPRITPPQTRASGATAPGAAAAGSGQAATGSGAASGSGAAAGSAPAVVPAPVVPPPPVPIGP